MSSPVNELLGPIHNTHLTTFRRCEQKFKYAFIEGIQPKVPSLPLARGIWLHYCLQAQYLKWGIEDETLLFMPESIQIDGVGNVALVVDKEPYMVVYEDNAQVGEYDLSAAGMLKLLIEHVWNRLFEAEWEKYTEDDHTLPEACKRILTEYFYFYKDELKERDFEVLLVEEQWKRAYKDIEFEGRLDVVIRMKSNGLIVCRDWKSTKREPHPDYKFMESQLHLYPWGVAPYLVELGVPKEDVENMAVEFDYLSTKLPTIPSQNQDGSLSKRKINTTYLTLHTALKDYGLDKQWNKEDYESFLAKNEKDFFLRKRMPRNKKVVRALLEENHADSLKVEGIISNPDTITRTVSHNCSFDCDFLPLCKGELYGENVSRLRKTDYEPRTNTHAGVVDKED